MSVFEADKGSERLTLKEWWICNALLKIMRCHCIVGVDNLARVHFFCMWSVEKNDGAVELECRIWNVELNWSLEVDCGF